ncbi:hypothetical protein A8B78_11870 [Jannaschia sp. EhC01]|nr:hypothetical protein A8B78_11870 [Jannaschia sp. EhC01]
MTLLALAGGVYWWMSRSQETAASASPQPPLVRVAEIASAQTVVLRHTGFVRASDEIGVVAQVSERITQVGTGFAVGELVREGDLLIALDAAQFSPDRSQAQARLDQARAALTETEITLQRQQELAADDFASDAALDDAEVAIARAQADLAMAQAQLERATLAVDDTRLTAPFDAIVTAQGASRGQYVAAGTSVGHLIATDTAEVRMGLLPSDIAVLGGAEAAIGLAVTLSDPTTGRALRDGVVTGVAPAIDAQTRTTSLIIRVDDPFNTITTEALRVGELVQLDLDVALGQNGNFRIPAEALKGADNVWRVVDGTLSPLSITLVTREGRVVIVRHPDLSNGDTLLLSDLVAPQAGDRVRVAGPGPDQTAEGG